MKKNTPKKIHSNHKQLTKKELLRGISITLLISILIFLIIHTLTNYFNEPSLQFLNTLENFYNDFNRHQENLKSLDIIKYLNANSLEINSDLKVNSSNLNGDLDLDNILNSLDFTGNIRLNRKENYQSFKLKMSKDSIEKMNIEYLKTINSTYLKSTHINNENYILLNSSDININAFKLDKTTSLVHLFKDEFVKIIEHAKYELTNESLTLNNHDYNCRKITYSFTSQEFNNLIDLITFKIISNGDLSAYLSLYLNTDDIESIINHAFKVPDKKTIDFSVYINDSDKKGIKLEIKLPNLDFSYQRIDNFTKIESTKDGLTESISLIGTFIHKYMLTIESPNSTFAISSSRNKKSKEGTITKIDNLGNKAFDCNFSYMISEQSPKFSSLSASLNIQKYDQTETGNIDINISSLINNDVEIQAPIPRYTTSLEDFEKENNSKLKDVIINGVKSINLNNLPTENLPSSFKKR